MQLAREVMSPGLPLGGGCDALLSGDGSAWEVKDPRGIGGKALRGLDASKYGDC